MKKPYTYLCDNVWFMMIVFASMITFVMLFGGVVIHFIVSRYYW